MKAFSLICDTKLHRLSVKHLECFHMTSQQPYGVPKQWNSGDVGVLRVELYFLMHENTSSCFNKFAWILTTWVKTLDNQITHLCQHTQSSLVFSIETCLDLNVFFCTHRKWFRHSIPCKKNRSFLNAKFLQKIYEWASLTMGDSFYSLLNILKTALRVWFSSASICV